VRVRRAAELALPRIAQAGRVLHRSRVLQHPAWGSPVGEELRPILLAGDRHADGVLGHRNRRVAHQPIKTKTGYVQYLGGIEYHRVSLHGGSVLGAGGVLVVELAVFVAVHLHAVGHQRVERGHLALAVSDDLRIRIAPEQQVGHQRFAEYEAGHLRVGLAVQQGVQRVILGLVFTRVIVVTVQMERQACDCLGQDAHAGIDCRHLHRRSFVHRLATGRTTEEEAV